MAFIKLEKPTFILGNFMRGFIKGSADEIVETFTDAELTDFSDKAKALTIKARSVSENKQSSKKK